MSTRSPLPKISMYHAETLRRILRYDDFLTEATIVLRCNKALRPKCKVRFTRRLLDEVLYEMLEDMEIEGNCIDGWRKVGMDVAEAMADDYRGIPSVHVVEGGSTSGIDRMLRGIVAC